MCIISVTCATVTLHLIYTCLICYHSSSYLQHDHIHVKLYHPHPCIYIDACSVMYTHMSSYDTCLFIHVVGRFITAWYYLCTYHCMSLQLHDSVQSHMIPTLQCDILYTIYIYTICMIFMILRETNI